MTRSSRKILASIFLLALVAGLGTSSEKFRRRARILSLKLRGELPFVSWSSLVRRSGASTTIGSQLANARPVLDGVLRAKVLREGPCPVLWETPIGPFWGRVSDGEMLVILLREQYGDRIGPGPAYRPHEYQRGPVVIRSGDVVLDAGAHLGTFSRAALKKGAGLVVAIEPEPTNVLCFKQTFAEEIRQGRVIVVEAALWDTPGTLTLQDVGSVGSSVVPESQSTAGVRVRATTIDETVQSLHLERVDFIKMDIEGAERQAVRGGRQTLRRFGPRMALCTYHRPDDPAVIPQLVMEARPSYKSVQGAHLAYFYGLDD